MQQTTKVGFIGLGAMGFGMAASLCRTGFAVTGYDVREEALARLLERGGARAATPAEAARGAQLLFAPRRDGGALQHRAGRFRP
jgi:putative dehydrogenase